MPTLSPTSRVAQPMMTGIVNKVMMLLSAVSVTDRATSPPANLENTLDELPPGQQAMSTSPMKKTGGSFRRYASPRAIAGRKTSWPTRATTMGQGRRKTFPKSSNRSASPRSNIRRVRMGRTILMVFIRLCRKSISRAGRPSGPGGSGCSGAVLGRNPAPGCKRRCLPWRPGAGRRLFPRRRRGNCARGWCSWRDSARASSIPSTPRPRNRFLPKAPAWRPPGAFHPSR